MVKGIHCWDQGQPCVTETHQERSQVGLCAPWAFAKSRHSDLLAAQHAVTLVPGEAQAGPRTQRKRAQTAGRSL